MIHVLSVLRLLSGQHMEDVDIVRSALHALLVSDSFVMIIAAASANLSPISFLSPGYGIWICVLFTYSFTSLLLFSLIYLLSFLFLNQFDGYSTCIGLIVVKVIENLIRWDRLH